MRFDVLERRVYAAGWGLMILALLLLVWWQ